MASLSRACRRPLDRCDVLIIGAGPAGSTAALVLARAGWNVALVDKSAFPRRKVCGGFISGPTWSLLADLGVGAAMHAAAGPAIRRIGLFARGGVAVSSLPEISGMGSGRALRREILDTLLLDAAMRYGARIWQPCRVHAIRERQGMRECALRDAANREHVIQAALVIDARGSPERTPASSNARPSQRAADLLAFKAHFNNAAIAEDLMPLLAFPGGYGGMVTTDGGRVCLSCCIRRDMLEGYRRRHRGLRAGEALFEHMRSASAGVRDALQGAERIDPWLASGAVHPGLRAIHADGAFRVGNAAGEAHPVIAEGISIAIQSAYVFAAKLIEYEAPPRGAGELSHLEYVYRRAWRKRFARRIRVSALVARLAMSPNASKLLEPAVRQYPSFLRLGARLSGKTAIGFAPPTCRLE